MCATIALDHSGQELTNQIANSVYEESRSGQFVVPSFPDFQPLVQALKNGQTTDRTKSFRVSAQRFDQLLVLEAIAKKWLDSEITCDRAKDVIDAHNHEFNNSGDYWIAERTCVSHDLNRFEQSSFPLFMFGQNNLSVVWLENILWSIAL